MKPSVHLDEAFSSFTLFTAVRIVLQLEKDAKFCIYTATVVTRTRHVVTLCVHCLSCYFCAIQRLSQANVRIFVLSYTCRRQMCTFLCFQKFIVGNFSAIQPLSQANVHIFVLSYICRRQMCTFLCFPIFIVGKCAHFCAFQYLSQANVHIFCFPKFIQVNVHIFALSNIYRR